MKMSVLDFENEIEFRFQNRHIEFSGDGHFGQVIWITSVLEDRQWVSFIQNDPEPRTFSPG